MTGRVAVVTGATTGIGREIARGLARAGATVVTGARDADRGEAARAGIAAEAAASGRGGDATVLPLDLADQSSIRAFGRAVAARYATLDILVNNAGAWFTDRRVSPDGYELTFATNVLGPHLLTEVLLDRLRAAGHARIVNVVSTLTGDYDASDLQYVRRGYDGLKAYTQSKQALMMLTWGLATRLAGSGVTANAAAPGFVRTEFNRNARGLRAAVIRTSARLFAVSPAKGAETPLWVATAAELTDVTGRYFVGHKEAPARYREPGPIAELERLCHQMEQATA